ncbi:MAG: cation transporter dimerization domain-containing protein, partial [Methanobacteriaceae archaeon]|nr:cation transporter dimerization domain-containing protein [Methanobacteriaceae archaeon]
IIKTGIDILRSNVNILLDTNIIPDNEIKEKLDDIEGVLNVHNIRTRGNQSHIIVDMHIIVSDELTIKEAHDITHKCEDKLKYEYQTINEVLIHTEPKEGIIDERKYDN